MHHHQDPNAGRTAPRKPHDTYRPAPCTPRPPAEPRPSPEIPPEHPSRRKQRSQRVDVALQPLGQKLGDLLGLFPQLGQLVECYGLGLIGLTHADLDGAKVIISLNSARRRSLTECRQNFK